MASRRQKTFLHRYDPYLRFLALPIVFLLYSFVLLKFGEYLLTLKVAGVDVSNSNTTRELSLKLPKSKEDVMELASLLKAYKTIYSEHVLTFFCLAYIYKQAFAIPGSFLMNLLAGSLYGTQLGLPLVCCMTALGATICFGLSNCFGKALIERHFPRYVKIFRKRVNNNGNRIFFFLLGSRVFPMTPNWLLNIISPLAGIPGHLFFLSVLIGLVPYNFLSVQAGTMLAQMNFEESFRQNCFSLVVAAVLIILPGLIMPRVNAKYSPKPSKEEEAKERIVANGRRRNHRKKN